MSKQGKQAKPATKPQQMRQGTDDEMDGTSSKINLATSSSAPDIRKPASKSKKKIVEESD